MSFSRVFAKRAFLAQTDSSLEKSFAASRQSSFYAQKASHDIYDYARTKEASDLRLEIVRFSPNSPVSQQKEERVSGRKLYSKRVIDAGSFPPSDSARLAGFVNHVKS